MDLKRIKYFTEVARLKSFSKAAKVLYVSQTAVSQQIAVLEKEVGVELLIRDKKKVQLTSAGNVFLLEANRLIRQYENAVIKAKEAAYGLDGMIKIGFFSMFDRDVIAPALADFHLKYPKVKLNIVQCSYKDMRSNLLNGTIDIGFSFHMESDEIEELGIYQTYPQLCVNRNHRLADKTLIEPKDLEGEHVISYIKNKEQSDYYEAHRTKASSEVQTDVSLLVENMDDAVMLVNINAGIAFLPKITDFINPDKVVFIDQEIQKVPFDVNAYWIKANQNPVLQLFLNVLSEK
ncbi:MAG TPA: LysR family transcriptional regulator [Candidatus Pelethocola excrementipullorum]|nr:LysR family transcriptional regulator [Candidatus Pelethocola excrementipullorum]